MSKPHGRSSSASSTPVKRNGKAASSTAALPQTPAPRPAPDDRDAWKAFWAALGQPWRTEPEIDSNRQAELARCRAIDPDIEQGIYPFSGMKLSRADVEWLLATHESKHGPIHWSQQEREGIDLRGADLRRVNLQGLPLAGIHGGLIWFRGKPETAEQREAAAVHLEEADLSRADLRGANLRFAHLERADLYWTHLERADLNGAYLVGADLQWAHLERAYLLDAHLEDTDLRRIRLDSAKLENVVLSDGNHVSPQFADIQWGNVNLAVVEWSQMKMLGDEQQARQETREGVVKSKAVRLKEYEQAVRANRQLGTVLQGQGLNEEAARFAYRAQVLQKTVFRIQSLQSGIALRKRMQSLGAWLFSWFLFLIAGYGYRPSRSFLAYLLVISGFATVYYLLGHAVGPTLSPLGAFVFSMTSFHGRGFFPGNNISLDNPLTVFAALEALVGLIIEVTFIATLTQRFFNR